VIELVDILRRETGGRGKWWQVTRTLIAAGLATLAVSCGLAELADDTYLAVLTTNSSEVIELTIGWEIILGLPEGGT
jgi:hypothetical protein